MGCYTDEVNIQILIALLKKHGIRKIVASPGTTNISFVASVQFDKDFEVYSCVDERSAAYMACGMSAQSGESVVLSCTGATASRNYLSALTEAYYRKLPILAVTSAQHLGRIGQNIPQVIDRSQSPKDTNLLSVHIPSVQSDIDRWACELTINKALLELRHRGGGPVHINLVTNYSEKFDVKALPEVNVITRIESDDELPELTGSKVGIVVGNHKPWTKAEQDAAERFCETYNAVVICDHTSKYHGRYKVNAGLVATQRTGFVSCRHMDVLISFGDVSGAYLGVSADEVWRVNPDGEVRDTYKNLKYVFEMTEKDFLLRYTKVKKSVKGTGYLDEWLMARKDLEGNLDELPFSNCWLAKETAPKLPIGCTLHFGILNSLRSWNFFDIDESVDVYCNTGGFGIDGCLSSLIGASIVEREKLFFGVIGDLSFFYDMNALGNRHIGSNLRLLVVNNGNGTEFKNYMHTAYQFGQDADKYISAAGHFGKKSKQLMRHYAEDLGFLYLSASNKQEYLNQMPIFVDSKKNERPMLFEIFTDSKDESDALKILYNLDKSGGNALKELGRKILGEHGYQMLKKMVKE